MDRDRFFLSAAKPRVSMACKEPADAEARRRVKPVICYPVHNLPPYDAELYKKAREGMTKLSEVKIPPRDARCWEVPKGHFFRLNCVEGPQVGDLNIWNAHDMTARFFSGKTRQLHATHVTTGDRLWSTLPGLRPLATITHNSLDWYGFDEDGGGVHDVIGTRCDPYTNHLLKGQDYNYCCHSNLTRAVASHKRMTPEEAELHVHDVLNVFMCTGFSKDTKQYFMKASPVRPGDFIEFFAEIDLLCAMSACPGGDCGSSHSDDVTPCYPMLVEIYSPGEGSLADWAPPTRSRYGGKHGM
jgi:uncharacterized protein YcgI (DUF1989 family)